MTASSPGELTVCFVSASYPPASCGIGDYTWHLRRGVERVWGRPWLLTTAGLRGDDRTRVIPDWTWRSLKPAVQRLTTLAPRLVHMQYPGKLYGHRPDPCLLPYLFRLRRPRVPWLVTLHEFHVSHPLRKAAVLALVVPATGVIFTSPVEHRYLTAMVPGLVDRSCVIPIGSNIPVVSCPDPEEVRRRWGFGSNALVACHFGIVQPNKGMDVLLAAMAEAVRHEPRLHLLVIARLNPGESPHHARLADLCRRSPLSGRVRWTGYLPATEVSRTLQSVDFCVLPYRDGVSGRRGTFMAAAQHGLPILTTRSPGTHLELPLRHEHDVFFIETPLTAEPLAAALCRLAADAELRTTLRRNVAAATADRTWEAIARRTVACYRRALAGIPVGREGEA